MDKPTGLTILEKYAQKFLDAIDDSFNCEYGISKRDAERGTLAVLIACGHADGELKEVVEKYWQWEKDEEEHKRKEREDRRRASLSPEMREREDEFQALMDEMNQSLNRQVFDTFLNIFID